MVGDWIASWEDIQLEYEYDSLHLPCSFSFIQVATAFYDIVLFKFSQMNFVITVI